MAIEESLCCRRSSNANYWSTRGGFKATVINTEKIGQVHFLYKGDVSKLELFFVQNKANFFTESITKNMQKKRGGILDIVLQDKPTFFPTITNFTLLLKLKIAWALISLIPA
jgi:hydroxymethylglutaryl-CoA reductase